MNNLEITLPVELASDGLTLEEIGALYVLMALPKLDRKSKWFIDDSLLEYLNYFIDEEIVIPSKEDGNLGIEIDLTWL